MNPSPEQRRSGRWLLRTPASLKLSSGQVVRGRSFDISTGGLSVIFQQTIPSGSIAELSLMLTHAIGGKAIALATRAKVIDCVFDGRNNGFRVGMQFLELDAAVREAIESHLPSAG